MTTQTITVATENGTLFPQHVGGIFTPLSALNLSLRYAALTEGDPDPNPVLWIAGDSTPYFADYLHHGYNAEGHLVATMRLTANYRWEVVYRNSVTLTPPNGAVTSDAAADIVNAYVRAAR